jgi:syntaxin-binding protein 1
MDLRQALQQSVLDMMSKTTNNGTDYAILVTDNHTLRLLSSVVRMQDISEKGILMLQDVEASRAQEKMPNDTALFFLSPTKKSVKNLLKLFVDEPHFGEVHLYFSGALVADPHDDWDPIEEIKNSPLASHLACLTELSATDFYAFESRVFSCERQMLSGVCFPDPNDNFKEGSTNAELKTIARQIAAVCETTKQIPFVRYHATERGGKFNEYLARELTAELKKVAERQESKDFIKTGTLLIMNRTVDPLAPLVHEFSYQAQVFDLFHQDEHGLIHPDPPRAALSATDIYDPSPEEEAKLRATSYVLNDSDQFWVTHRHQHVSAVAQSHKEALAAHRANPAVIHQANRDKGIESKVKLSTVAANLGAALKTAEWLDKHLKILGGLNKLTSDSKQGIVEDLSEWEMNLLTGHNTSGQRLSKEELSRAKTKFSTYCSGGAKVSISTNLRLSLIKAGVLQDTALFLDNLMFPKEKPGAKRLKDLCIKHLGRMMEVVTPHPNPNSDTVKPKHRAPREDQEYFKEDENKADDEKRYFPNQSFISEIGRLMQNIANGQSSLDEKTYPYIGAERPPTRPRERGGRGRKHKVESSGPPYTVFVLGGITFAEMREVYKKPQSNMMLGSDCILTPNSYLRLLTGLRRQEFAFLSEGAPPSATQIQLEKVLYDDEDEEDEVEEMGTTKLDDGEGGGCGDCSIL